MTSLARFCFCLVFVTLGLKAGNPFQGMGTIGGTVVHRGSGQPVRKSVIRLDWQGQPPSYALARTAADGRFRFEGLPAGRFVLRAEGARGELPVSLELTLGEAETRTDLVMRAGQEAAITGRVADPEGDPIAGAEVELYQPVWREGRQEARRVAVAETNLRGEYRLGGLRAGRYVIAATGGTVSGGQTFVFPRRYLGGATEWGKTTVLRLSEGQSLTGADLQLTASRLGSWSGRCTGLLAPAASGRSVAIHISALDPPGIPDQSLPFQGLAIRADGQFRWGGMPGVYSVMVAIQAGGKRWAAVQRMDLTEDRSDLSVTLAPPIELSGRIRMVGEGNPAPAPTVRLTSVLIPGIEASAGVARDGTFRLRGLYATAYRVSVEGLERGAYVESIRLGDADVRSGFEVTEGLDQPLAITVNRDGLSVDAALEGGTARSGESSALLVVADPRLRTQPDAFFVCRFGLDSRCRFAGVPPGRYQLFGLADDPPLDVQDPAVLSRIAPWAVPVETGDKTRGVRVVQPVPDSVWESIP